MTVAPTPVHGRHAPRSEQLALLAAIVLLAAGVVSFVRNDGFQTSSRTEAAQGSGVAATESRELAPFSSVDLAGGYAVTVRIGATRSVVVRGDDNLLGRVTTRVQGGSLVIGSSGDFATKVPLSVEVSVPSLETLTLSGSGVLVAERIRASRLALMLEGSGVLRASGAVTRLDVSLGGSGDARLGQLVARDVHATLNGSGRILVTATNSLDASVPGSGAIVYGGHPAHVTTSVTGTGAVVPR